MARLRPRNPGGRRQAKARAAAELRAAQDRLGDPASPEAPDDRGCPSGKVAHESSLAAWRLVERIPAQRRGSALRAYRCALCGAWHLTSRPDAPNLA
jgi:hypothetical protein